jgi:hypothetical protein
MRSLVDHNPTAGVTLAARHPADYFIRRAIVAARDGHSPTSMHMDVWECDLNERVFQRFLRALTDGLAAKGWELIADTRDRESLDAVFVGKQGRVLHVRVDTEDVVACGYGATQAEVREALGDLDALVMQHAAVRRRGNLVPVRIWKMGSDGPTSRVSQLRCPRWSEIAANYPAQRERLGWLMGLERPFELGRVIFWHGPSGTGKTWAVRALIREWRRMQVEVVTDPDAFLNDPALVNQLLLDRNTDERQRSQVRGRKPRGRVLIFEDAPALHEAENGEVARTTLAKLLNATDGLLDNGVPTVVLATTHEALPAVESALTRPGRCLQVQHFPRLNARESTAWLASRGCQRKPRGESSLAELYALERDNGVRAPERPGPVGFAATN